MASTLTAPQAGPLDTVTTKSTLEQPENWPTDITYAVDLSYTVNVTSEQREALCRTTAESQTFQRIPAAQLQQPYPWLAIQIISKTTHPALGQRGLFATQDLPPDSFVCLYVGLVHHNSLSDTNPDSDYDLSLDRDIGLSVDAALSGNESRCANDYRGIAERPNTEFRDCLIAVPSAKRAGGKKWERRVAIFVLSAGKAGKRKAGVRQGEEILVSYGKSFWEARKLIAGFRKDDAMLKMAERALQE